VYALFALSGLAGLIYESVWARYLGLLVGHTAYAQVLVLAIFMGGLAAGAAAAGTRSSRFTDPLNTYGAIEIAIGALGMVFHPAFVASTAWAYDSLFPALASDAARTAVKWMLAGALILPQAVLLGATFPLMATGVLRRLPDKPGRVLSYLYFTNSMGGAIGVLLAGFLLVAIAGLPGTVATAAIVNVAVGMLALAIARRHPLAARSAGAVRPAASDAATPPPAPRLSNALLIVAFGTAVASFIYEIGWLRMLALVLGSATHSFEIMLSAFILGLACGAFWVRRRTDRWRTPIVALGVVQCAMGLGALATLPVYEQSFKWAAWLLGKLDQSPASYAWFSAAKYVLSLAVMFPATFCAGMTLPLLTRTLLARGHGEHVVGEVYASNTLGAIFGAIVAGLFLLPMLGLHRMLVTGAALDMAIGVALLAVAARAHPRVRKLATAFAVVSSGALALALGLGQLDPRILTTGVFRTRSVASARGAQVFFYRDGRTATVSVHSHGLEPVVIATNGKADGSLPRSWLTPCGMAPVSTRLEVDVSTQVLMPLVAAGHAPNARWAAVIGHGTGISAHTLLGIPTLERVTTIEIEPAMIFGSQMYYPANARVFDDPRSEFAMDDARSFFAARGPQFDLIISEPSNPWVSGVASLFTVQFYRQVARSLNAGGVFGQWLQLYESNDELVLTILSAVHRVFPDYVLFQTSSSDLLIVASLTPLPDPDWRLLRLPAFGDAQCRMPRLDPHDLEALRVTGRPAFDALLSRAVTPNSDFHPVLDLGAERARFAARFAQGFQDLGAERFGIGTMLAGRRLDVPEQDAVPVTDVPRALALARSAAVRAAVRGAQGLGNDQRALGRDSRDAALALFEAAWRSRLAPEWALPDWRQWIRELREIDAARSGGAAGVDDPDLYGAVETYLASQSPPPIVPHVVRHLIATARWDFQALVDATDSILEHPDAQDWVPNALLVESAVVAHSLLGDRVGARRVWAALAAQYPRPRTDVRRRIVEALVAD
jgi:predicted membrane-bound spermidine synthase